VKSLPDALHPWREWLSWFDPDLATQLGPLLQRLHPLLGPLKGCTVRGEPELEGLDDLRIRGAYEHLLASEWLIAEDLPDEFLRRAASGEHIFLAPRPQARRADRSIVAVFDTGPLQLGAPRLAHLAIWILLARRALQAQGEFRWGVLQSPGELFEARTVANLTTLLDKRSFVLPVAASLTSWSTALDQQQAGGERWVIGSSIVQSDLRAALPFTHRVCVQNDLERTSLEVSLFERGTERGVRLPLPQSASAVSLLRGTFIREASPERHTSDARAVALMRPPVIAFDGTRISLALRDEPAALTFPVPRSAQDKPGAPRYQRWSTGYSALAMSFINKRMGVLLSSERELRFWGTSLVIAPYPTQEQFRAPGGTAAWLPLVWLRVGKAQRVCIVDQSKRLLRWDSVFDGKRETATEGSLQLIANNVLEMVQIHKGLLAYAYHDNGSILFTRLGATGDPQAPRPLCNAAPDAAVLFGRGSTCAVRLKKDPETWGIGAWNDQRLTMHAQLPDNSRVVGLTRDQSGRTGLITLDRNTLRLHFAGGGNELLYTAPDRIVSCTVCPNTSVVAMLTQQRQFIVVSAATRELCLSVQTARQSHASA
jgi:hypothetical protein